MELEIHLKGKQEGQVNAVEGGRDKLNDSVEECVNDN